MRITAGTLKGREIVSPKGDEARPTSSRLREAVFNICSNQISGADFLDICAGSGIMSFEAISRGAKSSTLIEQGKNQLHAIKKTIEKFQLMDHCNCMRGDARKVLKRLEQPFDLIYADPPYSTNLGPQILQLIDQNALLQPGGIFFLEEGEELATNDLISLQLKEIRHYGSSFLHIFIRI